MNDKIWNLSSITLKIENMTVKCSFTNGITDFNYHLTDMAHIHTDFELHYIFEGECKLVSDDKEYILGENSLCIVPALCSHFFPKNDKACKGFGILMSFKHGHDEENEAPFSLNLPRRTTIIKNDLRIRTYFDAFIDAYKNRGFGSENKMESALTLLFLEMASTVGNGMGNLHHEKPKSPDETQIMLETIIMSRYLRDISLNDVAKAINFTPAHTGRLIKKIYKKSYSKLILELRMKYARKKILTTDLPFSDIAERVGYESYTGFWMAFKRYWGISPEQMKQSELETDSTT
ncbi:MAG: helix-turn-helix transcriptional regulator [Clostridia bacterium]|nr:helix-turn-helix transcriptional regulator [Clostridia bacterium]